MTLQRTRTDRADGRHFQWREVDTKIDPKRKYKAWELEAIAEAMLRADSMREFCDDCVVLEADTTARDPICVCPECGGEWDRDSGHQRRTSHGENFFLTTTAARERHKREVLR